MPTLQRAATEVEVHAVCPWCGFNIMHGLEGQCESCGKHFAVPTEVLVKVARAAITVLVGRCQNGNLAGVPGLTTIHAEAAGALAQAARLEPTRRFQIEAYSSITDSYVWCVDRSMEVLTFATRAEAEAQVSEWYEKNRSATSTVFYRVREV